MSVTVELPEDALARLRAEAARRGVSIDVVIAELAAHLPAEDPLEAFIGCGASGRTEPFDIHHERAELAAKKHAEGV
jgi:Ribbon-helix-helix protein, copG family